MTCTRANTVVAHVAAIEQVYVYNRYGSYNSQGLMYALRRDIVANDSDQAIAAVADEADAGLAGRVRLRSDKRPRPLVLRIARGDCIEVHFTNLLSPSSGGEAIVRDPGTGQPMRDPQSGRVEPIDRNRLATRTASMQVPGLELASDISSSGDNVGLNGAAGKAGIVQPGQTIVYRWLARTEGAYLMRSIAAPVGGEGDGGQLGLGLFGAINVEPEGSIWFRSQVSGSDFAETRTGTSALDTPIIDYCKRSGDRPLLAMRDGREIVSGDVDAVIMTGASARDVATGCVSRPAGGEGSFREFTVIFHDQLTVDQAFTELEDDSNPMSTLRDGMGINYGASGLGSAVLANRDPDKRFALDPTRECVECKLEEFFLSAWVVGDPAMIVRRDSGRKAQEALYSDDPSNVHNSYMSDPVKIRNIHAGPQETHIFHLHAHQWLRDEKQEDSSYLDSQTISPGSSFTYDIKYGGSGNRNLLVGDSIFHCHLYPHFAQGMWGIWRSHDVFEDGRTDRRLPDTELAQGSAIPAVVPIPGRALPPMPSAQMPGYPFYIAGRIGHRPPQPPMDLAREADGEVLDGGLPRHVVLAGERVTGTDAAPGLAEGASGSSDPVLASLPEAVEPKYFDPKSDDPAVRNARRVRLTNRDPRLLALATKLTAARIETLPWEGTTAERAAMDFHAGTLKVGKLVPQALATPLAHWSSAIGYRSCDAAGNCYGARPDDRLLFVVNGQAPQSGAPFADPCLRGSVERRYRAAYVQVDLKVTRRNNGDGTFTDNSRWHDPQGRIAVLEQDIAPTLSGERETEPLFFRANSGECVLFQGTNLMPSVLNLDDFQVYTPTDTIGQHIHLVKFDVTSSDGSANGWNYEDATFSPDEVIERIIANNAWQHAHNGTALLKPRTHRLFRPGGAMAGDARGQCGDSEEDWHKAPWCGAQSTLQRWWADPQLAAENGPDGKPRDKTLRTVFSHDHLGPSSHQQHGLYAALVIEPAGSNWTDIYGEPLGGITSSGQVRQLRSDGGPTSYAANILPSGLSQPHVEAEREFNLAIADYAPLYICQDKDCRKDVPVNPPGQIDEDLPRVLVRMGMPRPEGISTVDPGGQTINYRTEPMPERVGFRTESGSYRQWQTGDPARITDGCRERFALRVSRKLADAADRDLTCDRGDLANVFSSVTHGDPATPVLRAYAGDKVQIRLVQGAQEENHVVSVHGTKWLNQPERSDSGFTTAQQLGISEHFEFGLNLFSGQGHASEDHLYMSTATDDLWSGAWGILRAYGHLKKNMDGRSDADSARIRAPKALPNNALPDMALADRPPPLQRPNVCPRPAEEKGSYIKQMIVAAWARDVYAGNALRYSGAYDITDPSGIALYAKRGEPQPDNGTTTYTADADYQPFEQGGRATRQKPLVIRVNAGDCLQLTIHNRLTEDAPVSDPRQGWTYNRLPALVDDLNTNTVRMSRRIGFHVPGLAANIADAEGAHVGFNKDTTVRPDRAMGGFMDLYAGHYTTSIESNEDGTYVAEHHLEAELGVLPIVAMGDAIQQGSHGAVGAVVVEPRGAVVTLDPHRTDAATVEVRDGNRVVDRFREFVVIYQDDAAVRRGGEALPNLGGEGNSNDTGQRAWNLSTAPLWARIGAEPSLDPGDFNRYDWSHVFSSQRCADDTAGAPCAAGSKVTRDPPLVFTARAGEKIRFRIVQPSGHPRNHAFALVGHNWVEAPWNAGKGFAASSIMVDRDDDTERKGVASGIGPRRHMNLLIDSAGGRNKVPGDYLFYTFDSLSLLGGLWGILRVLPADAP